MQKISSEKENIGILGGTFNPIHIGHLLLAQNAINCLNLDKVIFIPAGIPYFKNPREIAAKNDRLEMVRLSIKDNPQFEMSTIETDKEGNSYTCDTLEELINDDNNYYYIIGADTLFSIEKWKKPEVIFNKATVVCAHRNGYTSEQLKKQADYLSQKYNGSVLILDIKEIEISSTAIRQLIFDKKSTRYYLNSNVIDYISDHNLYNNTEE